MTEAEQRRVIATIAAAAQHDANNLMTVVLATVELMRRDSPADDKAVRRLDRMEAAGRRLQGLLRGVFTLARQPAERCDAAALLHRLDGVLRLVMAPSATLAIDAPEEGVEVAADPAALAASLVAALRDAREATLRLLPEGVEVTLPDQPALVIGFGPGAPPTAGG